MDEYRPGADRLCRARGADQSILEQTRADLSAMAGAVDGKPPDENERNGIGKAVSYLPGYVGPPFRPCGKTVVPHDFDAPRVHEGSYRLSFVLQRTQAQPVVEGVLAAGEA